MEKRIFNLTKENAERTSDAELSDVLFGNKVRIIGSVSDWKKENATRYTIVRKLANENGRLAQPYREQIIESLGPKETRRLSPEEIRARMRISREECDRLYRGDSTGDGDNLSKLKESDLSRYTLVRQAHQSYQTETDLVPRSNIERQPLDAGLIKTLNLPEKYQATGDEFLELLKLKHDMATEAQKGQGS